MNEAKEFTVREATILTLENSQSGLADLKEKFQKVSESFDSGNDAEGLALMKDDIIVPTSDLYEFCFTIVNAFDDVISDEVR